MQIGTVIRDYKILSKLGSGGMGEVWLAEHIKLQKQYALKILNRELTAVGNSGGNFVGRFIQEAKVLAELDHPNIVKLYNLIDDTADYCMVLEYARGINLAALLKKKKRLSEDEALKIFCQLLEGVGYAHSMGIVHRDLKPSNIVFDEATGKVKILDFGIAKILGSARLTSTGSSIGTVMYMSPEQVRALPEIDQRTDIYNLGLLLYEMLAGELPYNVNTESNYEISDAIVKKEYPDVRLKNPAVSAKTAEVIRQATMKEAADRPVTCFKVAEMLNNYVETENKTTPETKNVFKPALLFTLAVILMLLFVYFANKNGGAAPAVSNPPADSAKTGGTIILSENDRPGPPKTEKEKPGTGDYGKKEDQDKSKNEKTAMPPAYTDGTAGIAPYLLYFNSGNVKFNRNDLNGAIEDYTRSINIKADYPGAYNNRGNAKRLLKDYSGAADDYTRAAKLNPGDPSVFNNRGSVKAAMNDNPGAIADYTRALELNPKYARAYSNRAAAKYAMKDLAGAVADYSSAIEYNVKDETVFTSRGNARYQLKDYAGAIEDFSRAVELNPAKAVAYFNRGNARQKTNDIKAAVQDWQKARDLGDKDAQKMIEKYGK